MYQANFLENKQRVLSFIITSILVSLYFLPDILGELWLLMHLAIMDLFSNLMLIQSCLLNLLILGAMAIAC